MLHRLYKSVGKTISDILDTDEKIYIQTSKRSSDASNSNFSRKVDNSQLNEDSHLLHQTLSSQNPTNKNTADRSTLSQRLYSLSPHGQGEYGESNTSSAWREYTSSHITLQEYDASWLNIYHEESNRIKNSFQNKSQSLILDMEHVGSTSVEGMCAKPIIDILIICGDYLSNRGLTTIEKTCDILIKNGYQPRYCCDLTTFQNCINWMQEDGIFVKKGFIIHFVSRITDTWKNYIGFIAFREYLQTHSNVRRDYNHYKKSIVFDTEYHFTIKEYTLKKDAFVNNLIDEAITWYRKVIHCIHIGVFNKVENRWSCCNARENESNSYDGNTGCYYRGLKKDSYHPGRFHSLEYNFIDGWYTCCSQGRYSNGCVKVILLENDDALLKNCEEWDVNNVCRWTKSLSSIDKDYSNNFRLNNVTGRILLTVVDDETLQALGVTNVLHRKLFQKALEKLKIKSTAPATMSSLSTTIDLSPSKTKLKKNYYDDFQGDFTPLLATDEMSTTLFYNNASAYRLTNKSHQDIVSRIYHWLGPLPSQRVDKIEYVFNAGRYRMFLSQLESIENRQMQSVFQPTLNLEENCQERERVLKRLDRLYHQVEHNRKARIVRMWHGCRSNILPNLLSDGFAALGTLDEGWYGKAIYFTSSAEYATRYCDNVGGCLIMCYILLLNPFPVISADALPNVSPKEFRFYGKGNYKNYQCHYIPVSPGANQYNLLDYRPPPSPRVDAVYDELAVFQESTILPQIVIHLK